MLPNANLSCKILDSLSTELHVLCGGCFGVGEINPCSTKITALIRSTLEYWYCYANYYSNSLHCVGRLGIIHHTIAITRRACTHACDVGTGCKYWTGGVMYILVWCVILDRCVELDWCVVCTGLVCCMYWTGVLQWRISGVCGGRTPPLTYG